MVAMVKKDFPGGGTVITWEIFEDEIGARFGPTGERYFDEALSRIKKTGSLRDYQRAFERLGNRVRVWIQKALMGTFIGGLKPKIVDGIRMFKPKSMKEVISLAHMNDDQLNRQGLGINSTTNPVQTTSPMVRKLSWKKIQIQPAQGLCFNCNDKFTMGHKCNGALLLILEGIGNKEL